MARPLHEIVVQAYLADISTAGSAFVAAPDKGKVVRIQTIIDGALATADAALTFEINGTAITGSAITVTQSGSAAGDVDSSVPTALSSVEIDDQIEVITDGASTNTVPVMVNFTVRQ